MTPAAADADVAEDAGPWGHDGAAGPVPRRWPGCGPEQWWNDGRPAEDAYAPRCSSQGQQGPLGPGTLPSHALDVGNTLGHVQPMDQSLMPMGTLGTTWLSFTCPCLLHPIPPGFPVFSPELGRGKWLPDLTISINQPAKHGAPVCSPSARYTHSMVTPPSAGPSSHPRLLTDGALFCLQPTRQDPSSSSQLSGPQLFLSVRSPTGSPSRLKSPPWRCLLQKVALTHRQPQRSLSPRTSSRL